ncbi:MAG TPA: energy transducer TonB [Vicinamibacterales bacterium]|nr:energy transducer TonB [Vicinamibacterales bacterium]
MKALALAAAVTVTLGGAVAAQSQTIYKAGDPGVTNPVVRIEKKPAYTAAAMRQQIQGSVELEAVIDAEGKPTNIRLVRSLDPTHGLDANAMSALEGWRFKPATREGKPVPFQVTVELTFRLRDGPTTPIYKERAVEVEGLVGTDGTVSDVRVVNGINPELDAQAVEAFKGSTFKPAMLGGRAVPYRVTMRFPFPDRN